MRRASRIKRTACRAFMLGKGKQKARSLLFLQRGKVEPESVW